MSCYLKPHPCQNGVQNLWQSEAPSPAAGRGQTGGAPNYMREAKPLRYPMAAARLRRAGFARTNPVTAALHVYKLISLYHANATNHTQINAIPTIIYVDICMFMCYNHAIGSEITAKTHKYAQGE